ncbi:hypothetical protein LPTSP4_34630 [Leptospira ryugenii]|uniref:Uncharacterized protein n=1 Tax=Leptospira ryugenii TaxID=1917863 RepID=A0A2P2E4W2_9LEPT|nr:hypothetical protein LPTSP4_34630 [Leptospira ryugenii]
MTSWASISVMIRFKFKIKNKLSKSNMRRKMNLGLSFNWKWNVPESKKLFMNPNKGKSVMSLKSRGLVPKCVGGNRRRQMSKLINTRIGKNMENACVFFSLLYK